MYLTFRLGLCIGLLMMPSPQARADDGYPNKQLLVEPATLMKPESKKYVVLDARGKKAFATGHVPAARWVDHADWEKGFDDGTDAAAWGKRIGALGITPDSTVVVYDDSFAKDASRVWWILRYWGVTDVRILNGGWTGWRKEERPAEAGEKTVRAVPFTAVAVANRMAGKDDLLKSLDAGTLQIVDARSENEFCGLDPLKNKKAGAVPGAKHLEWIDLIDKPTQRFKPPAELQKLFAAAGIKLDRPTATHCQSGGRASVMAYGLELMGAKDVRNYYKSWSEWGNAADTPVVKPEKK